MAQPNRNTINRPDTFFGICEAIGQDFGFNPLWLRLAFVPPVFFQPLYAFAAYAALGVVVLASRLLFPTARAVDDTAIVPADVAPLAQLPVSQVVESRTDEQAMALAA